MVFCPPFSTEPMTHAGTYHGIDHTLGAMGEKRRVGAGGGGGEAIQISFSPEWPRIRKRNAYAYTVGGERERDANFVMGISLPRLTRRYCLNLFPPIYERINAHCYTMGRLKQILTWIFCHDCVCVNSLWALKRISLQFRPNFGAKNIFSLSSC